MTGKVAKRRVAQGVASAVTTPLGLTSVAAVLGLMLLSACGKNDGGDAHGVALPVVDQSAGGGDAAAVGGFNAENEASLTAFAETLWPLLRTHCSGCHGGNTSPFFAASDPYNAHKVVVMSHLAAPTAVPSSRFVTRLALNNHNCWTDCPADARAMQEQIKAWFDKAGITAGGDELIRVGPLTLASAVEVALPGSNGNWVREAEHFDQLGEGFTVQDDGTASAGKMLQRVPGEGETRPVGDATYFFPLPAGDGYRIWFRVRDAGVGRGLDFRINGGRSQRANLADNSGDWTWVQAGDPRTLKPLLGSNNVSLGILNAEVLVDMVAFTVNPVFDRGLVENTGKRRALTFDLASTLGRKASLVVYLEDGPDASSYLLSHPTLRLDEEAKVAVGGIYVLANGEFNPQYSTFASVQTEVTATSELSPRGLVVIRRDEQDTVTLGLRRLQLLSP